MILKPINSIFIDRVPYKYKDKSIFSSYAQSYLESFATWSHFYNLPAAFLNITLKSDMLQISFFAKTFQSLCLRKRINFTSAFYESPTDIIS